MAISLQSSLESILINTCFAKCGRKKNDRRLFLMDNDQSQTSKAARKARGKIEAELWLNHLT
jgi:hypothetical protein